MKKVVVKWLKRLTRNLAVPGATFGSKMRTEKNFLSKYKIIQTDQKDL